MQDVEELLAFFEARQGMLYGFRWKDWADFKSVFSAQQQGFLDQTIGQGDGAATQFQLSKTYVSGGASYTRPITKPVEGSVRVGLGVSELNEGSDFSVDTQTGMISFAIAPQAGQPITAGFEFDVPVRFDTDRIQTSMASFQAGQVPDVPILEVRI